MPEYDPALCPLMYMDPVMYPAAFRSSAGAISGGLHTPTSGCATNSFVNSRKPCLYFIPWPWELPIGRYYRAEAQYSCRPAGDLRLYLGHAWHS